jgi:hypothetical protein
MSDTASANRPVDERHCVARSSLQRKEVPMLYAILAYHVEAHVASWTAEQDAAVMTDLHRVHDRLNERGRLGPPRAWERRRAPAPCEAREREW